MGMMTVHCDPLPTGLHLKAIWDANRSPLGTLERGTVLFVLAGASAMKCRKACVIEVRKVQVWIVAPAIGVERTVWMFVHKEFGDDFADDFNRYRFAEDIVE